MAALAAETKTRAIKVALLERRERLTVQAERHSRAERLNRFLADEAWPQIPDDVLDSGISRAEREQILGYGSDGV